MTPIRDKTTIHFLSQCALWLTGLGPPSPEHAQRVDCASTLSDRSTLRPQVTEEVIIPRLQMRIKIRSCSHQRMRISRIGPGAAAG